MYSNTIKHIASTIWDCRALFHAVTTACCTYALGHSFMKESGSIQKLTASFIQYVFFLHI